MSSVSQPRVVPAAHIDWSQLHGLVAQGELREATSEDVIDGVRPTHVVEPGSESETSQTLAWANRNAVCLGPRGGGTKLGWGCSPVSLSVVLSTRRMGRILEHAWADMTATVEAGCTVAQMQRTLAEHGQRLAIDPLFPQQATIGGVIATNDSGVLRLRYGSVRDLIIGVTVALPDGTLATSGGKVVKNVAGYDLQKLMTGALGTLGVITKATFRVHPLPRVTRTLTFTCPDITAANMKMLHLLDSVATPAGIQLRVGRGGEAYLDVLIEGIESGVNAQEEVIIRAVDSQPTQSDPTVWQSREGLFDRRSHALICKIGVLPSQLAAAAQTISRLCSSTGITWQVVAQATGLGILRMESEERAQLAFALNGVRSHLAATGGTAVVLECPFELKKAISVWGPTGDSQSLILRVKQQFDPIGILNRGRFVGGI